MQYLFIFALLFVTSFAQQDVLAGLDIGDLNLTELLTGSQINAQLSSVTEQLLQDEIDDLKEDLKNAEKDLRDAKRSYSSKINALTALVKKQLVTTKTYESKINTLDGQVKAEEDSNKQLSSQLVDLQDLYDQLLQNFTNFKAMHANEVQQLNGLIQNCTNELNATMYDLRRTETTLSQCFIQNTDDKQAIDNLNATFNRVYDELVLCNDDLYQCQTDKLGTEQQLTNCTIDGVACEENLVDSQDFVMNLTSRLSGCENRETLLKQEVITRDQLISQLRGNNANLENSRDVFNGSYNECVLNLTFHMNLASNQALQITDLDKERAEYKERFQNCSSKSITERAQCKARDLECKKTEGKLLHCEQTLNKTTEQLQFNIERKFKYQKESGECVKSLQNCSVTLNATQHDLTLIKLELDTCKVQKDMIEDNSANCTTEKKELENQLNIKQLLCKKDPEQEKLRQTGPAVVQRNCQRWLVDLKMPHGKYRIDPDGESKGVAAFEVHCKFENGQVITEVPHDPSNQLKDVVKSRSQNSCDIDLDNIASPNTFWRKDKSRDKRSYSSKRYSKSESKVCSMVNVEYPASQEQLIALKAASKSCKQVVTWQCVKQNQLAIFYWGKSKFSSSKHGIGRFLKFFKSRNMQEYKYSNFHPSSSESCDCAGSCPPDSSKNCSCYANDRKLRTDTITINDKDDLPIQKLALGDVDDYGEKGSVSVGDLICY